jgi:hypothetical protein
MDDYIRRLQEYLLARTQKKEQMDDDIRKLQEYLLATHELAMALSDVFIAERI